MTMRDVSKLARDVERGERQARWATKAFVLFVAVGLLLPILTACIPLDGKIPWLLKTAADVEWITGGTVGGP